jgi:hypothetical protein
MSDDDQRNTLIVENAKHTGIGELQGMTNQQLVEIGRGWFDWSQGRLESLSGDYQRAIIEQICAFLDYRDTWMQAGERLAWVAGLLGPLARSADKDAKRLAVNLLRSVWRRWRASAAVSTTSARARVRAGAVVQHLRPGAGRIAWVPRRDRAEERRLFHAAAEPAERR